MIVKLLIACTIDGMIARDSNHFVNWSGSEDKKYFKKITTECGVMIMGKTTFDLFKKPLPNRLHIIYTNKQLITDNPMTRYVNNHPGELLNNLKKEGFTEVAVIGGTMINSLFAEYIDEIHLTICPKVFGTGLPIFSKELDIDLNIKAMKKLDENLILIIYNVGKK